MKQMILDLDEKQQRPVIILKNGITALLDTGAYMPIWTGDERGLIEDMGAELIKNHIPITGFGGTSYGNLYQMTLQVGDLIYPRMHIVANNDLNTPFYMIFSAAMFQHLVYEIDDKHHKLNISVPDDESLIRNLVIEDKDGKVHVLCSSDSI